MWKLKGKENNMGCKIMHGRDSFYKCPDCGKEYYYLIDDMEKKDRDRTDKMTLGDIFNELDVSVEKLKNL